MKGACHRQILFYLRANLTHVARKTRDGRVLAMFYNVVDMLFRLLRESEWNEIERAEITPALEALCEEYRDQTGLVYQLRDAIRIVNMPKEEPT